MFLGLTLGCCVCHDHKFDPITQKEFYRMFGYFGSLTERPMDGNALLPPPAVRVSFGRRRGKFDRLQKGVPEVEADIRAALRSSDDTRAGIDDRWWRRFRSRSPRPDELRTSLKAWEASVAKDESRPVPPDPCTRAGHRRRSQANKPTEAKLVRDYFVENVFSGQPVRLRSAAREARRRRRKELIAAEQLLASTLVMQDMPKPRDIFVLVRGAYDRKGEKVLPGVPAAIGPRLPADCSRESFVAGPLDRRPAESAHRPGDGQSFLAALFRHRHREDGRGLRRAGRMAHASRAARLAGDRIRAKRLGRQAHPAADRHLGHLSAIVARERRTRAARSRESPAGPRPAVPLDAEMVRDMALAVSGLLVDEIGGKSVKPYQPPGLWEAIGYSEQQHGPLREGQGRRPLSPHDVHVLEADVAAAVR